MRRFTTLLAFALCTAAQAQSIEIAYALDLRAPVALPTHGVGLRQAVRTMPLPACVQPWLVKHLMQNLCLEAQVPLPTVNLPSFWCVKSDGPPGSALSWGSSNGVSSCAPRADIDGLALASDSPASGPVLWLRADAGVRSSAGRVSVWRDLSGQGNEATMATSARQPMPPKWGRLRGLGPVEDGRVGLGSRGHDQLTQMRLSSQTAR